MAAPPSFCIIVEEDLTCPACFELLRDPTTPKLLDCPHVCCTSCLHIMRKGNQRYVDCMECCHVARMPRINTVDDNIWVDNLGKYHERASISKHKAEMPSRGGNHVGITKSKDEDGIAYSDAANNNIQVHNRNREGTHNSRPSQGLLPQYVRSADVTSQRRLDISTHCNRGNCAAVDCSECSVRRHSVQRQPDGAVHQRKDETEDVVCSKSDNADHHYKCNLCTTGAQSDADKDGAEMHSNEQAMKMKDAVHETTKEIQECKKNVKELKELQKLMENHLKVQQKIIEKQAEQVIKRIQEESKDMIINLAENVMPRIDSLKEKRTLLKNQIERSKDTLDKLENELEKTESAEISVMEPLDSTVSLLIDNEKSGDLAKSPVMGMAKFVYGTPYDMPKVFGCLLPIQKVKCTMLNEFGAFQLASFITATPHGLLVVSDYSANQVYVYSDLAQGQYRNLSRLALSSKTSISPYGVAVTAEGRYLVARFKHVEVYSPAGKYQGVLKVRPSGEPRAHVGRYATGIETTTDGRVVISDLFNSTLTIIEKDGVVSKTVQSITKPVRLATRFNGYAITNSWKDGKICVINLDLGKEVQIFDIPHSSAVCYHKDTDSLFVGRCLEMVAYGMPKAGTGCIEQYCATTGRFVGRIAEGLYMPRDFTFTSEGLLVVADTKTAKVYKIV
ncbi:uncharacterized protein [Amphiura filiformis]|uniref:uncharacterized protein n=1 Tax=Amphiura filiformis TaxID=82378 RepID=UPI003B22671C